MSEIILNTKTLKQIGSQLWDARTVRNISQEALGEKIGKQQSVVSQIESNRRLPSLKSIVLYLDALGLQLVAEKKPD